MTHQLSEPSQIWKDNSVHEIIMWVQHQPGESVTSWITGDASSNINIFHRGPPAKPASSQPGLEGLPEL